MSKIARVFFLFALNLQASPFLLGVDVFLKGYTYLVKGQRVGLVTNQTGKNERGESTIDLLHGHPDVNLISLFAPEHGIRGVKKAGEIITETVDSKTGLPIHSLYGGNDKRPSDVALNDLDILIYDIQDVGSRAYTYIWSMVEALAAAGENGKSFMVLDRPNPLSCKQIDGPITEDKWRSFLGLFPIPRVYGMTVGELARYFNNEYHLQCRLIVIPMASYNRNSTWDHIGAEWTAPSPNIPSTDSAICFPATGTIGTLGSVHIGIGTRYPFQIFGTPWLNANHAASYLNNSPLPGIAFKPFSFVPKTGLFRGQVVQALKLDIKSPQDFMPTTTEVYILHYLQKYYKDKFAWNTDRLISFDKAMGTSQVRNDIINNVDAREIVSKWEDDLRKFRHESRPYRIYE